jgi:hypothetical protein
MFQWGLTIVIHLHAHGCSADGFQANTVFFERRRIGRCTVLEPDTASLSSVSTQADEWPGTRAAVPGSEYLGTQEFLGMLIGTDATKSHQRVTELPAVCSLTHSTILCRIPCWPFRRHYQWVGNGPIRRVGLVTTTVWYKWHCEIAD